MRSYNKEIGDLIGRVLFLVGRSCRLPLTVLNRLLEWAISLHSKIVLCLNAMLAAEVTYCIVTAVPWDEFVARAFSGALQFSEPVGIISLTQNTLLGLAVTVLIGAVLDLARLFVSNMLIAAED